MPTPSTATVKRLFAVSKNRCAFPNCRQPLVDDGSGKVTGRIAHIKARQPGGPRFDGNQTDEARHSFENLLLLCPIHHDVIDSDLDAYTVDRLLTMKSTHEKAAGPDLALKEGVAEQFLVANVGNNVIGGSVIFNQNQLGGQVAHTIQNFGPPPRRPSSSALDLLRQLLSRLPPENIELKCVEGDADSFELAVALRDVLRASGWHLEGGVIRSMYERPMRDILVVASRQSEALDALILWLSQAGFRPSAAFSPSAAKPRVNIGPSSAA